MLNKKRVAAVSGLAVVGFGSYITLFQGSSYPLLCPPSEPPYTLHGSIIGNAADSSNQFAVASSFVGMASNEDYSVIAGNIPIISYSLIGTGDQNNDGNVALDDFAGFSSCFNGPDGGDPECCWHFDLDGDNDVDLKDVSIFMRKFSNEAGISTFWFECFVNMPILVNLIIGQFIF